jgi:putative transposase
MDGGFFELRRQLDYKAWFYGATIVVADKWLLSSKTCSCCGSVKAEPALSQRMFRCHQCDRDQNAARNLACLAASFAVSACGEERFDAVRKNRVKRAGELSKLRVGQDLRPMSQVEPGLRGSNPAS